MSTHTIEIGDEKGKSFKISLTLSFNRRSNPRGSWRSIDKGFIRFNSGVVRTPNAKDTVTTVHAYLLSMENTWGIKLEYFEDFWGLNDEGKGEALQAWVLGLDPGKISWAVVD